MDKYLGRFWSTTVHSWLTVSDDSFEKDCVRVRYDHADHFTTNLSQVKVFVDGEYWIRNKPDYEPVPAWFGGTTDESGEVYGG